MDFRCFLLLLMILKEQLYKRSAAKGTTDPRRECLNHLKWSQIKASHDSGRNKLGTWGKRRQQHQQSHQQKDKNCLSSGIELVSSSARILRSASLNNRSESFCQCDRVVEVGSLSARGKTAIKIFVKRIFTISRKNPSFLHVIANLSI